MGGLSPHPVLRLVQCSIVEGLQIRTTGIASPRSPYVWLSALRSGSSLSPPFCFVSHFHPRGLKFGNEGNPPQGSAAQHRHTAFAFSQPWLNIPYHSLIYYQVYATQAPSTILKSWDNQGGGACTCWPMYDGLPSVTPFVGQCLVRVWHTTLRVQCHLCVQRSAKAPPHFAKLISGKRACSRSAALGGPSALPRAGRLHGQCWWGWLPSASRRRRVLRSSTQ